MAPIVIESVTQMQCLSDWTKGTVLFHYCPDVESLYIAVFNCELIYSGMAAEL
jgi:hypothetical protein